jgi:nucleotide-binding universal stress UspA family protein
MTSFRKILVPVDFSEHSDLALQRAAALSRSCEAPLTIVYVNEPLMLAVPEGYTIFTEAQLSRMFDWLQERLETAKRAATAAGALSVQALMLHGFADGEIQKLATEGNFDLIVMGTHGRRGLSHALLGSVTERVVRTAPCPVLSVRAPGTA